MMKLAKLDPQPTEYGIFATGSTRQECLGPDGREVQDPDWDTKPFGTPICGVWLAESAGHDPDWNCESVKSGPFCKAPKGVTFLDLMTDLVVPKKLDDGWWWVSQEEKR